MREASGHLRIPAFAFWIAAGSFGWGSTRLHAISSEAPEPTSSLAVIGCVLAALVCGVMVLRALNASDFRADRLRMDRERQDTSKSHGHARFASAADLRKFGLLSGKGTYLGRFREPWRRGQDIWYSQENGCLTIAPPGAGKGTCGSVVQTLVDTRSMVIPDIKQEHVCLSSAHRRDRLGHEVFCLSPFAEKINLELGVDIASTTYNPYSIVRPGPTLKDDAELFSSLLIPIPPKADASAEFFLDAAQQFCTAGTMDLARRGRPLTLPALRSWLMASPESMKEQLLDMMESTAFNGVVREMGSKLFQTLKSASEEFSGGASSAQKALRLYDSFGPLGAHVSGNQFNPEVLKRRAATVYLCLPPDYSASHAPWMNLALSTIMETIGRDRSHTPVTILAEELANLGYLPNILRTMALYRAQGLRVHGYIQQISQIRRLYGDEGWRDMVGMCDVVQAFGITEYETLKLLSDMAGQTTVETVSQNVRPSSVGRMSHAELTFSHSRTTRPLLSADDIRLLHSSKQLIFYRNMPPLIADKVDYRFHPVWSRWAAANPYYTRESSKNKQPIARSSR